MVSQSLKQFFSGFWWVSHSNSSPAGFGESVTQTVLQRFLVSQSLKQFFGGLWWISHSNSSSVVFGESITQTVLQRVLVSQPLKPFSSGFWWVSHTNRSPAVFGESVTQTVFQRVFGESVTQTVLHEPAVGVSQSFKPFSSGFWWVSHSKPFSSGLWWVSHSNQNVFPSAVGYKLSIICLASRKFWSVEKLETLPSGTKPRTSHHWSPGWERRWKRKR